MEAEVVGAIAWFLVAGMVVGLLFYAITIYNNLVRLKHAVARAWSNIDVLLTQRHAELPKLVEACKQYKNFEQQALEKVMQARTAAQTARRSGDVKGVGAAETQMRAGLGQLFAVAEAYPDLKANESFRKLQQRISQLEETIADRREFYNDAVNNNVRIEQFPDTLIARRLDFGPADLLEFSAEEKSDVEIGALFT